jgi:hypothetical protein
MDILDSGAHWVHATVDAVTAAVEQVIRRISIASQTAFSSRTERASRPFPTSPRTCGRMALSKENKARWQRALTCAGLRPTTAPISL